MTFSLLIVAMFAIVVCIIDIAAIAIVLRSTHFHYKPVWIAGALFGVVGLGISWPAPGDVIFLTGVQIPVLAFLGNIPAGPLVIKAMLSPVAIVALVRELGHAA